MGGLSPSDFLIAITLMALAGVAIGFLAGFFGVGGGAISVPVFYEVFGLSGVADEVAMPLAVGTSLAMIIPTAIVSTHAHAKKGTLNTNVLRRWALPILSGVVLGSVLARFADDARMFQVVFILVAGLMSARMLLGDSGWTFSDTLPARWLLSLYGSLIGLLSALMGIGGGALSTMVLSAYGRPIHEAVSTSAGVGLLIAVPGTIGYIVAGWGNPELPSDAIGYLSLFALTVTLPTTLLTTRLGVRAAHNRTRSELTRWFGLFLLAVAIRFLLAVVLDM